MAALIQCPHCKTQSSIPDGFAGHALRCKKCNQKFSAKPANMIRETRASSQTSAGGHLQEPGRPASLPQEIAGFTIHRLVGEGAFGRVFLGYDAKLQRWLALKVPHPHTLASSRASQRFEREARAAAQLRHPHIVPVYAAGQDGTHHYIAAQFIAGPGSKDQDTPRGLTLDEAKGKFPLDYSQAARMVHDLAEAMHYAHSVGIVHRDIKPANVMVDEKMGVHLADFGLAHLQDSMDKITQDGAIMGTPAYMAPELAKGVQGEAQPASDQYSLGIVLYELLCGQVPFTGPVGAVLSMHIHNDPPAPHTLKPNLPRDLETICLKALSKGPIDRYESCQALADDLRRFLDGEPIQARRLRPAERLLRWCKKNPLSAGLVAGIFLVLMVGTGIATAFAVEASRQAQQVMNQVEETNKARELAEQHAQEAQKQAEIAQANLKKAEDNAARAKKNEEDAKKNLILAKKNEEEAKVQKELANAKTAEALTQQEKAFQAKYLSDIVLAQHYLKNNQSSIAKTLLTAQNPEHTSGKDFRGFEWYYLKAQLTLPTSWLKGHFAGVLTCSYSSDGNLLASGSADKSIKIWEAKTGKHLLTLTGHNQSVTCVTFSPDSEQLASCSSNNIKIWDVKTGTLIVNINENVNSLSFSPDGTRLACGSWDGLKVFYARSGNKYLHLMKEQEVGTVAYSPDGNLLISASSYGKIRIWWNTGKLLKTLTKPAVSVSFNSDGTRLASAALDGNVSIWDPKTGQELLTCRGDNGKKGMVCFSQKSDRLASADDNFIHVWDGTNGNKLVTLEGHKQRVTGLAFSPDGKYLVSSSLDSTIKFWDMEKSKQFLALGEHTHIILNDSASVVSEAGFPGEPSEGYSSGVKSISFHPDGIQLVSTGSSLILWDTKTARKLEPIPGTDGALPGGGSLPGVGLPGIGLPGIPHLNDSDSVNPRIALFSPDGSLLAYETQLKTNSIIQLKNAKENLNSITPKNLFHKGKVMCLCFSADASKLAAGSNEKSIKIWDAKSGNDLLSLTGHGSAITTISFCPESKRLVSGSVDKTIKIWDARTGNQILNLVGHKKSVTSVSFNPDGTRLASAGDDMIKIWDARTGKEILKLEGHTKDVTTVAFSPDGNRLASGSADNTIKIWDVKSGQQLLTLEGHSDGINCVAFSPDGNRLASGSRDGTVRIWEGSK